MATSRPTSSGAPGGRSRRRKPWRCRSTRPPWIWNGGWARAAWRRSSKKRAFSARAFGRRTLAYRWSWGVPLTLEEVVVLYAALADGGLRPLQLFEGGLRRRAGRRSRPGGLIRHDRDAGHAVSARFAPVLGVHGQPSSPTRRGHLSAWDAWSVGFTPDITVGCGSATRTRAGRANWWDPKPRRCFDGNHE